MDGEQGDKDSHERSDISSPFISEALYDATGGYEVEISFYVLLQIIENDIIGVIGHDDE